MDINATFIEWLRYNAFLILYPIGFAAEMRCWYGLIKFLTLEQNINDNAINYRYSSLSLRGWSMITFALTPFVGSYMYYGMLVARRKYMLNRRKHSKKD